MGRYLIIDPEQKSIEIVKENLTSIDQQAIIETFANFQDLNQFLLKKTPEDQKAYWDFNLMILEYSLKPPKEWGEIIENYRKLNIKDLVFLFSGYDDPHMSFKNIRALGAYNFIFKPYDQLILKESLNIANQLGKHVQPLEMKAQEASAFVGILKEVELQSMSELGFVTLSEVQFAEKVISKYFSPIFRVDKKQSVWAQCLVSFPHPQKPDTFINKFQFIAVDQHTLNTIRRFIQNRKQDETSNALWSFQPPAQVSTFKIGIVGLESEETEQLIQSLQDHFENVTAELIKLDPQKKSKDIAYDHKLVINLTDIKIDNLKSYFSAETQFFLVSPSIINEDDLNGLAQAYIDICAQPYDRYYLFKKMKIHIPGLKQKEPTHLLNIATHDKMKATSKVKISNINEISVSFTHYRELPLRTFREFAFITEDETKIIELRGICHYTEKAPAATPGAGPSFIHQFMFYGMTDMYLKQIRLWLLQNYIVQHQKND